MKNVAVILLLLASTIGYSKDYKSAEVFSNDTVLYGKFEMSIKAAKASGTVSTFFLYKDDSWMSGKFWQEFDIEIFGKNTKTWQSNIITGNPKKMDEGHHSSDTDLAEEFHKYTIEWTPEYIAWYLNDVEIRKTTGANVDTSKHGMSLRFNLWPANLPGWVGNFDD